MYDLTVEGAHEFFAADVLVHNSRVHHVGIFPELEDEMTTWTPDVQEGSPDRMDALVWAVTELLVEPQRKKGGWSF